MPTTQTRCTCCDGHGFCTCGCRYQCRRHGVPQARREIGDVEAQSLVELLEWRNALMQRLRYGEMLDCKGALHLRRRGIVGHFGKMKWLRRYGNRCSNLLYALQHLDAEVVRRGCASVFSADRGVF